MFARNALLTLRYEQEPEYQGRRSIQSATCLYTPWKRPAQKMDTVLKDQYMYITSKKNKSPCTQAMICLFSGYCKNKLIF